MGFRGRLRGPNENGDDAASNYSAAPFGLIGLFRMIQVRCI